MKESKKALSVEIKKFLDENQAENEALKKLIVALQSDEMKKKRAEQNSGESTQLKTK
jgi:hypothetical protein